MGSEHSAAFSSLRPALVAAGPGYFRWVHQGDLGQGKHHGPRSLPLFPCEPGAAVAALQRALGELPRAGRAGPGSPAARAHDADEEIEPHPQAGEEGAEHRGPLDPRSAFASGGAAQLHTTNPPVGHSRS
jgi:hypothetical protein